MSARLRRRAAIGVALLALTLASCSEKKAPLTANSAPSATAESAGASSLGRKIYNFRCYFCHGYSGDARTLAATYLTPPPSDFTAAVADNLTVERIVEALRNGRPGTAMQSFAGTLSAAEIDALARFVHDEFVVRKAANTRYHTAENGWPDHERYQPAFPFARGEIALTVRAETLSAEQQSGRRLYLESCVSCHDRGRPTVETVPWEGRPLSFPRNNYDHRQPEVDATTSATPYRLHDVAPRIDKASRVERLGERLYQENCAFCHAADGTGKNWIGSFLEPHPRDLTDKTFMSGMTRARLARTIRDGLPNTSMPAWKSVLAPDEIDAVVAYVSRAFHLLP